MRQMIWYRMQYFSDNTWTIVRLSTTNDIGKLWGVYCEYVEKHIIMLNLDHVTNKTFYVTVPSSNTYCLWDKKAPHAHSRLPVMYLCLFLPVSWQQHGNMECRQNIHLRWQIGHIDGLVQKRSSSCALSMELRLFCTDPSISTLEHKQYIYHIWHPNTIDTHCYKWIIYWQCMGVLYIFKYICTFFRAQRESRHVTNQQYCIPSDVNGMLNS